MSAIQWKTFSSGSDLEKTFVVIITLYSYANIKILKRYDTFPGQNPHSHSISSAIISGL